MSIEPFDCSVTQTLNESCILVLLLEIVLAVKTHVCAVQEKRLFLARVHGAILVLVLAC